MNEKVIFIVLSVVLLTANAQVYNFDEIHDIFTNDVVEHLGNGSHVTIHTLEQHFRKHLQSWTEDSSLNDCHETNTSGSFSVNKTCLLHKVCSTYF